MNRRTQKILQTSAPLSLSSSLTLDWTLDKLECPISFKCLIFSSFLANSSWYSSNLLATSTSSCSKVCLAKMVFFKLFSRIRNCSCWVLVRTSFLVSDWRILRSQRNKRNEAMEARSIMEAVFIPAKWVSSSKASWNSSGNSSGRKKDEK